MGLRVVEKNEQESVVELQCRIFTELPFPPKIKKATIRDGNNKVRFEGYMPKWEKKVGSRSVKIIADPEHGFPYGNDILVVLFLIQEARRQGRGGEIVFRSVNDFLRAFDYGCTEPNRKNAFKAFQRIFYATWFYEDGPKKHSFRVMSYCQLFPEDGLFQGEEYENKIVLTPEFWKVVQTYPVPYDKGAAIALKRQPTALNLYLFLVWRTWVNWRVEKEEIFLPFFGENGLHNQFSSEITADRDFRREIKKWLEQIKSIWPDCPVFLKRAPRPKIPTAKIQRAHLDGLFIHCTKPGQLHVEPHWDKELRLAQEEARETEQAALVEKLKPTAKQAAVIRRGGTEEQIRLLDAGEMSRAEASEIIGGILAQTKKKKELF